MQFDLTKFLLCRAIAENADPDTPGANRVALVTSLFNMDLAQSAVLTSVLAAGLAPSAPPATATARGRGRRAAAAARRGTIKVPNVGHLSDPTQIQDHLREQKLKARLHRVAGPEIKRQRVARMWPEPGAEVNEGAEINVILLVPEDGEHGEPEIRTPAKK